MLEFEVSGDRNNFIDLQKSFLEIKHKKVQSSGADLKRDAGAPTDKTKIDAPYFCNNVHCFLIVRYLLMGWKYQLLTETMRTKLLSKLNFLTAKTQRTHG